MGMIVVAGIVVALAYLVIGGVVSAAIFEWADCGRDDKIAGAMLTAVWPIALMALAAYYLIEWPRSLGRWIFKSARAKP